jgi:hypothetical protein
VHGSGDADRYRRDPGYLLDLLDQTLFAGQIERHDIEHQLGLAHGVQQAASEPKRVERAGRGQRVGAAQVGQAAHPLAYVVAGPLEESRVEVVEGDGPSAAQRQRGPAAATMTRADHGDPRSASIGHVVPMTRSTVNACRIIRDGHSRPG